MDDSSALTTYQSFIVVLGVVLSQNDFKNKANILMNYWKGPFHLSINITSVLVCVSLFLLI